MCIRDSSRALAWRLENKGPLGGQWKGVIAITRGGMVPAMIAARELDIRLVETISIKSYDHKTQSEAQILKPPNSEVISDGSGVIIIDDLVDSGKTMQLVRDKYPKAHFASVYAKPVGRDVVDTFITEVSQDTWIFFPWDMEPQPIQPIVNSS